jgi:hypothetical protein
MSLLFPLVEARIGPVSTWPRDILRSLFISPLTAFSTRNLAAFFYGNDLPCPMALQLIQVWNTSASEPFLQYIPSLYTLWNSSPDMYHLCMYWNLHRREYVLINDSDLSRLEFSFGAPKTKFGFGLKVHTLPLRCTLAYLRRTVRYVV